jgi:hypothetical protein
MSAASQKLVLTIPSSKMAAFMEMLKQYDFVKVDRLDEIITRFVRNAPKKVDITDDEIADILMEIRYGKNTPPAP